MIATNIGKIFLKAYNEKYGHSYSPKYFFTKVYYENFFNHNKYMMTGGNSPFENPKISWDKMRSGNIPYETAERRSTRFNTFVEKVSTATPDASIAIGYPSLDVNATTSGQITNLNLPLNQDDVYLSWIGSGLGVGVQGGLSILFDKPLLLLDIFEGWTIYRDYLNQTPQLRGNQITTWNGQWMAHRYNSLRYEATDPTANFNGLAAMKDGGLEITTQSWIAVMEGICKTYPDSQMVGYVYNIGQMNITIGFVPFKLPQIRRPFELYEQYFGTSKKNEVEQLFGTAFGFERACQMGSIGINAMEPKGLREYIDKGKMPVYNKEDEENKINFNTYQIWLLAMLNNEQLWEKAQQFAVSLNQYALSSDKGKTDKSNHVKAVLSSVNKKQFIDNLTEVVSGAKDKTGYLEMAQMINTMPMDNVPYFLTLVRFQFATIS
jgi:hypothetical protein